MRTYLSEVYLKDQFTDLKIKLVDKSLKHSYTLERLEESYRIKTKELKEIVNYGRKEITRPSIAWIQLRCQHLGTS